ncbi:Uu.00g050730.m01.CDS01 [Anthostomella pinea]|uniref:Uu.00g050730.m01.CDS01 n=1 Tax=Anthostomella pinea TaxID=933095 RepID=A0AAI8YMS9_9PEZI|nr:Uu.00g050730.m01.CDS01 [Anthostomella pinea]
MEDSEKAKMPVSASAPSSDHTHAVGADAALSALQKVELRDASHPIHWSWVKKWPIVIVYCLLQTFITLSTTTFVSAEFLVQEQYGGSTQVVALGQSMFIVGTAIGPAFLGPLSDIGGRKWVYVGSIALYAILNIGTALALNLPMLIIFQFLCGAAGSTALSNVAGTVADLFGDMDGAGQPMALFVASANIGPSIGSPVGEWIADNSKLGLPWIFWINVIIGGAFAIVMCFVPETLPRLVIKEAVEKHQSSDPAEVAIMEERIDVIKEMRFITSMALRIMVTEPIIIFLGIYNGFAYGLLFLYLDGVFDVFVDNNGLSYIDADLTYLNFVVGVSVMFAFIPVQTWLFKRDRKKHGHGRPEARFLTSLVTVWGFPISLLWFAFTCDGNTSFWSPVVAGAVLGFCDPLLYLGMLNYIADTYTNVAASAIAAFLIPSFLMAAGCCHIGIVMFNNLGAKWAMAVLGFISFGLVALVRIETLEKKIEELMRERDSTSPNNRSTDSEPASTAASASKQKSNDLLDVSIGTPVPGQDGDVIDRGILTLEHAGSLLGIFKTSMTHHFPFVILAPEVTAAELRHEKPVLFLSILSVAAFHDVHLQRKLGTVVKQGISHSMTTGKMVSFEMLQAVLVFVAWCQFHPKPRQYTQYLQLAISIVVDLRLDRAPMVTRKANVGSSQLEPDEVPKVPRERSCDEQRALAGVSKLLQKLNTFPYTDYLDQCCLALLHQRETPTDENLYYIIQLQRIIEGIEYGSLQQSPPETAAAFVHDAQLQLKSFQASLPRNSSCLLLMQYHTAELFLCQAAFFEKTMPLDATLHSELLVTGFSAAKSMVEFILSLPERAETVFNNSEWIQMSLALTVGARLSMASNYNLQQSLDLPDMIRRMYLRFGTLVTEQRDAEGNRDIFYSYEQRLRRIHQWFECASAGTQDGTLEPQAVISPPISTPYPQDASGLLTPSPRSMAPVPEINIIHSAGPAQDLPGGPSMWTNMPVLQPSSAEEQMADMFPELDHFFQGWDWSLPMNP